MAQLVYSTRIHDFYAAQVESFYAALCRGNTYDVGQGPLLTIDCLVCVGSHTVNIRTQAIRLHVIKVKNAAHVLLQADLVTVPTVEHAAYHAGLLDISRQYFPFLDGLIEAKNSLQLRQRHAARRPQRTRRNHAITPLLEAKHVEDNHLLEFMSCYRKHVYPTRQAAEFGLASGVHDKNQTYEVYACDYCDGWHVGHPMGASVPVAYRLSRARMLWATQRDLANAFVMSRELHGDIT